MVSYIFLADMAIPVFYHNTPEYKAFEVYGKGISGFITRTFLFGFFVILLFLPYIPEYIFLQKFVFPLIQISDENFFFFIMIIPMVIILFSPLLLNLLVIHFISDFISYPFYRLLYRFQHPDMVDIFVPVDTDIFSHSGRVRIHHIDDISTIHSNSEYKRGSDEKIKTIFFKSNGQEVKLGDINFPNSKVDKDITALLNQEDTSVEANYTMKNFTAPSLSDLIEKGSKRHLFSTWINKAKADEKKLLVYLLELLDVLYNSIIFCIPIFILIYSLIAFFASSFYFRVLLTIPLFISSCIVMGYLSLTIVTMESLSTD